MWTLHNIQNIYRYTGGFTRKLLRTAIPHSIHSYSLYNIISSISTFYRLLSGWERVLTMRPATLQAGSVTFLYNFTKRPRIRFTIHADTCRSVTETEVRLYVLHRTYRGKHGVHPLSPSACSCICVCMRVFTPAARARDLTCSSLSRVLGPPTCL